MGVIKAPTRATEVTDPHPLLKIPPRPPRRPAYGLRPDSTDSCKFQFVLMVLKGFFQVEVPNWELSCLKSTELSVCCTKPDAELNPVVIKDDQAGWVPNPVTNYLLDLIHFIVAFTSIFSFSFETTEHVKHNVNAESVLPGEFSTGGFFNTNIYSKKTK